MKTTLTLICLFILATCSLSQEKKDKGYIAFTVGPSFPIGDFADVNKSTFGPASTGFVVSVFSDIPFSSSSNVGLTAYLNGHSYAVDEDAIKKEIGSQSITVSSKNWWTASALTGLYGSFPVSESGVSLNIKAMVGSLYVFFPDLKFTSGNTSTTQTTTPAVSFAYMLGAGVKYNATNSLCLISNIDYLGSTVNVSNISGGAFGPNISSTDFSIGSVNISFGAGLRF